MFLSSLLPSFFFCRNFSLSSIFTSPCPVFTYVWHVPMTVSSPCDHFPIFSKNGFPLLYHSQCDGLREGVRERATMNLSTLLHTHTHKHSFYDERKSILSCISHLAFANKLLCVVGWKLKWPAGLHPNTGTDTGMGKLRFTPPPSSTHLSAPPVLSLMLAPHSDLAPLKNHLRSTLI